MTLCVVLIFIVPQKGCEMEEGTTFLYVNNCLVVQGIPSVISESYPVRQVHESVSLEPYPFRQDKKIVKSITKTQSGRFINQSVWNQI